MRKSIFNGAACIDRTIHVVYVLFYVSETSEMFLEFFVKGKLARG